MGFLAGVRFIVGLALSFAVLAVGLLIPADVRVGRLVDVLDGAMAVGLRNEVIFLVRS